ncbi:MAG TPA: hypothetical protein VKF41_01955 [Bryobacteraceae bacterium]|nr:hypothetical protein [Bryobacteraceae bacterium]
MKLTEEAEVIAKYAFESERKLRITAKVGLVFPTIKETIIREFVQSLIAQLKPRVGKAWDVYDEWAETPLKSGSLIGIYKPTWAMDAGVGLHCARTGPCDLNFYVYLQKKHKTPTATELGEVLDERYAHGGHSGNNPWWKYVDPPYRDWNTEDALIGLWKKHEAVDYYANHLLKIWKIASPFMSKICGK